MTPRPPVLSWVALCLVASFAPAAEPAFEGDDRKLIEFVQTTLAEHPKAYFYICPNGARRMVLRSSVRELERPGGRHPGPVGPVEDQPLAPFGRPSPEARAHVHNLIRAHNETVAGQPAQAPSAPKPNLPDKPDTAGIEPVAVLKQRPLLKDVPIERGPQPVPPSPTGEFRFKPDTERVQSLVYSSDGSRLIAWTGMTVVVWDVQKKEPVFETIYKAGMTRLTAPAGNFVSFYPRDAKPKPAVGVLEKREPPDLETRDTRTGRQRVTIKLPQEQSGTEMTRSISPDGRWIAAAGPSSDPSAGKPQAPGRLPVQVFLSDAKTGKIRFRLNPKFAFDDAPAEFRLESRVWATAFSNDSRYLAAATSDGMLTIWDTMRGSETASFKYEGGYNQLDGRGALVWIGDHDSVLVPVKTPLGFARCDLKTKKVIPLGHDDADGLPGGPKPDMVYAFTPDASRVVYSDVQLLTSSPAKVPLVFDDLATGKYIGRIPGIVDDRITALAYSPDGSHLAIGTFYGHIVIYAAADIEKLAKRQQVIGAVK